MRPRAERGVMAMDAVDRHLYSDYGIHLLWPAFSQPERRYRLRHAGLQRHQGERGYFQPSESRGR